MKPKVGKGCGIMANNKKQKKEDIKESRPLNSEEKKELTEKALKRVRGLLESLETWRSESLSSSFRF